MIEQQVVIIAAGYDTRAYRLGKPGVKFYEIDLPHASEMKQQLVKQHMPADKVNCCSQSSQKLHHSNTRSFDGAICMVCESHSVIACFATYPVGCGPC
jgi:hypothetical protein